MELDAKMWAKSSALPEEWQQWCLQKKPKEERRIKIRRQFFLKKMPERAWGEETKIIVTPILALVKRQVNGKYISLSERIISFMQSAVSIGSISPNNNHSLGNQRNPTC